ncbi:MAG: terminase [Pseudomonadota bacterium]
MSALPRITPAKRATFLAQLAVTANVTASCAAANVPRSSVYALKRRDAHFAKAWEDALQVAIDALEAEVIRRAIEGADKPQFYSGKQIGTVTTYSDTLAMFLLKTRRPELYGDIKAVAKTAENSDAAARYEEAY